VRIRDAMTEELVTAAPDASVRDVAGLMRDHNVGSVVLAGPAGVAEGILTDRDIALDVVAGGADPSSPALDHASAPVVTVPADAAVQEAADTMTAHGIRRLPVVHDGRLAGIITLDDLAVRTNVAPPPDFTVVEQRGG
jgi:CBS domain-containing protein